MCAQYSCSAHAAQCNAGQSPGCDLLQQSGSWASPLSSATARLCDFGGFVLILRQRQRECRPPWRSNVSVRPRSLLPRKWNDSHCLRWTPRPSTPSVQNQLPLWDGGRLGGHQDDWTHGYPGPGLGRQLGRARDALPSVPVASILSPALLHGRHWQLGPHPVLGLLGGRRLAPSGQSEVPGPVSCSSGLLLVGGGCGFYLGSA